MNDDLITIETAYTIEIAGGAEGAWHTRGYYGHIRHNVKAIYQKYLGWYDANPVHPDPLPPVESGRNTSHTWGGASGDPGSRPLRILPGASSASWRKPSAIWCSPIPPMPPPARCSPIPWSSSATPPKARPGATPICSARRSCGRACRKPRRGRRCRARRWPRCAPAMRDVLGVRLNGPRAEGKHIVLNWKLDRHQGEFCPDAGELRADLSRGRAGCDGRREFYPGALDAQRGHRETDLISRSRRQRQDHLHRQRGAAGGIDGPDG